MQLRVCYNHQHVRLGDVQSDASLSHPPSKGVLCGGCLVLAQAWGTQRGTQIWQKYGSTGYHQVT